MFQADLEPNRFLRPDGSLAVGWLENGREFPIGDTSPEFREKLAWLCVYETVRRTRGIHVCDLCPPVKDGFHSLVIDGGARHLLGTAEIRVAGGATIYGSPTLLLHYVVDHRYRPPDVFLRAVSARTEQLTARWSIVRGPYWKR